MNRLLLPCGVFIDLKKAFDTVDQDVLLDKLNCYGFRGIINSWFSPYLKKRTQTTQVDHYISDKADASERKHKRKNKEKERVWYLWLWFVYK